jgi:hypothetical protein
MDKHSKIKKPKRSSRKGIIGAIARFVGPGDRINLIAMVRVLERRGSETAFNSLLLNRLLFGIFGVRTAPFLRPPFGVSIAVIAQKVAQNA